MGFQVVLDANVLLPAPLRDTLLRLAEADLLCAQVERAHPCRGH
ncbi:MAG TPA: hypothetical protein VNM89_00420 [Solirubrobacterales bacterium]|nr:hypothetical protein [Solirubrobacterales bacterium]